MLKGWLLRNYKRTYRVSTAVRSAFTRCSRSCASLQQKLQGTEVACAFLQYVCSHQCPPGDRKGTKDRVPVRDGLRLDHREGNTDRQSLLTMPEPVNTQP